MAMAMFLPKPRLPPVTRAILFVFDIVWMFLMAQRCDQKQGPCLPTSIHCLQNSNNRFSHERQWEIQWFACGRNWKNGPPLQNRGCKLLQTHSSRFALKG